MTKRKTSSTGAGLHLYEINGWRIPNGMNWEDFCNMRVEQGFPRPMERKALYLEEKEDVCGNLYKILKEQRAHTKNKWKSGMHG